MAAKKKKNKSGEITLGSSLEIRNAAEFLATMQDAGDNVTLVASEVDSITTPCIQIIIATMKDVERKSGKFVISKPSAAFVRAFKDIGCYGLIENKCAA